MDELIEGEINSEFTGVNKDEKGRKKNLLILGIVIGIIFIISFILIIIFIFIPNNKNDEPIPIKPSIGEINCIYDIQTEETILILGKEFEKKSEFDIYIDEKIIKYYKEYKFDSIGNHKIKINLYNDINMDYMLKI